MCRPAAQYISDAPVLLMNALWRNNSHVKNTHAVKKRRLPGRGLQVAAVPDALMLWCAKHVGPVCENARSAPRETLLALVVIHSPARAYVYLIRRHELPPQRAGSGKSSGGLRIMWLVAPRCDWQVPFSGSHLSPGCWHSAKVHTPLTDN